MQEKEQALRDKGRVFGLPCGTFLGRYDHATRSLRTSQRSLIEDWIPYLVALPRSGTMRSGRIYEQKTWVLRTGGNAQGELPNPSSIGRREAGLRRQESQGIAGGAEVADAESHRLEGSQRARKERPLGTVPNGGGEEMADAAGPEAWSGPEENGAGEPHGTDRPGDRGEHVAGDWAAKSGLGGCTSRLHAWMDGWEDGIPRLTTGVPKRVDRLRGLGNSIVPQIAEMLFRQIGDKI